MRGCWVTMLLVVGGTASCDRSRSNGALPPYEVALVARALPLLPLQIGLPSEARVMDASGSVSIVLHPRQRYSLGIHIERDPSGGAFLGARTQTRALTPSLQLTYREEELPGEGSGDPEHVLEGALTVAGQAYRVTCRKQSELWSAAQVCLPVLATLRPVSAEK